jgi:hypothetical protein
MVMMRTVSRVLPRAALAACLFVILGGPLVPADGETVTLNGEIEAAQYDDDGNVTAAMVYDAEWGSVLILADGKGGQLINHIGATAEVTGTLRDANEDSDFTYEIRVSAYTILEPAEPYDDLDPELEEE